MLQAQEPKYDAREGRLVNRHTGEPIPDEEPVFILRAKDRRAMVALTAYYAAITDPAHARAVAARIESFKAFALANPDKMKEPDTGPRAPA